MVRIVRGRPCYHTALIRTEQGWRRNVEARLFVLTLRDYVDEISNVSGADSHDNRHRAEWAFRFINILYLQPIMEAFDDDGTGFITISEVNKFLDSLPADINWRSVPVCIVNIHPNSRYNQSTTLDCLLGYRCVSSSYTRIFLLTLNAGWQQAAGIYCKKILEILSHMTDIKDHVLPENRFGVDYYLQKVWKVAFELCVSLTQRKYLNLMPEWLESRFKTYVDHEEARIRNNLEDIRFDIDAIDTVYIVAGPGRIEKACELRFR